MVQRIACVWLEAVYQVTISIKSAEVLASIRNPLSLQATGILSGFLSFALNWRHFASPKVMHQVYGAIGNDGAKVHY